MDHHEVELLLKESWMPDGRYQQGCLPVVSRTALDPVIMRPSVEGNQVLSLEISRYSSLPYHGRTSCPSRFSVADVPYRRRGYCSVPTREVQFCFCTLWFRPPSKRMCPGAVASGSPREIGAPSGGSCANSQNPSATTGPSIEPLWSSNAPSMNGPAAPALSWEGVADGDT